MNAKSGICIKFLPSPGVVSASQDDPTVLDVALRNKIPLNHTCGGNGTCGTCLVEVVSGLEKLGPRNEIELEIATDRGFHENERLACQMCVVSGLVVKLKPSTME